MAKIISNEHNVIVEPWWVKGKIIYIGLGMGLLWWILTAVIRQYIVEPIACRDLSTAAACVNSLGLAGNIATVLVLVLGTFLLIRYLQPRPIIISAATAVLLWDLGLLMSGLAWWATLLWALFFYVVSYGLFLLVARIKWLAVAIIVAAIIAIGIRLLIII